MVVVVLPVKDQTGGSVNASVAGLIALRPPVPQIGPKPAFIVVRAHAFTN
jgi:hypothetical protein